MILIEQSHDLAELQRTVEAAVGAAKERLDYALRKLARYERGDTREGGDAEDAYFAVDDALDELRDLPDAVARIIRDSGATP